MLANFSTLVGIPRGENLVEIQTLAEFCATAKHGQKFFLMSLGETERALMLEFYCADLKKFNRDPEKFSPKFLISRDIFERFTAEPKGAYSGNIFRKCTAEEVWAAGG